LNNNGKCEKAVSIMIRLLLFVLALFTLCSDASAFFTEMTYLSEEHGKRDVLTFRLPPGADPPRPALLDGMTLRVAIPGLLALPYPKFDPTQTQFVDKVAVEEIPAGEMGLFLTLALREEFLTFRDAVLDPKNPAGPLYRLEIERHLPPNPLGPTRLLEGKLLVGRDGTLVVVSYTGAGWMEKKVDFGSHRAHLVWKKAELDPGWRPVHPGGLANGVNVYAFPNDRVELEVLLHPQTHQVHFHTDSKAGTLIIEMRKKEGLGRSEEAKALILQRKSALESGKPLPLNRLGSVFLNGPTTVRLQEQDIDETYFYTNAKAAERDHNYARARAFLDQLFKQFPKTNNRELATFYKVDLANVMGWKPAWVLSELDAALSRYPNHDHYPEYRLLQLKLLNRAAQFENAAALLDDPNLPRDSARVQIEKARTAMGLRRWDAARDALNQVLTHSHPESSDYAEGWLLLARLANLRNHPAQAAGTLDNLTRRHTTLLANKPEWLLEIADTYYKAKRYPDAVRYYAQFLVTYPKHEDLAPKALLGAAQSQRFLGDVAQAMFLFDQLEREFPKSESAIWGRIYRLQFSDLEEWFTLPLRPFSSLAWLEREADLETRLSDLARLRREVDLTTPIVESHVTQAVLLAKAGREQEALESLNELLTLTLNTDDVSRAKELKRLYLIQGMRSALEDGRPEYAILLGEYHGADWRSEPDFSEARLLLSEAMLQLGLADYPLEMLKQEPDPLAKEMRALGETLFKTRDIAKLVMNPGDRLSPQAARIRLAEAKRLAKKSEWVKILQLLENMPVDTLNEDEKADRLRLLAKAEAGRGRFPQAVGTLEDLLFDRPLEDGHDFYWYATLLQMWKGDVKSQPAFERVANEATDKEIKALAHIRIGNITQKNGDLAKAQEHYRTAAELVPDSTWAEVSREFQAQLQLVLEMTR
jgi:tetratricopeptide (TPR) repeat protein